MEMKIIVTKLGKDMHFKDRHRLLVEREVHCQRQTRNH